MAQNEQKCEKNVYEILLSDARKYILKKKNYTSLKVEKFKSTILFHNFIQCSFMLWNYVILQDCIPTSIK